MERTTNILFILNSLNHGGAERQTVSLVNRLSSPIFSSYIACLRGENALLPLIDRSLVRSVFFCDARSHFDPGALRLLSRFVVEGGIDTVVCTNEYPMLYGFLLKLLAKRSLRIIEVFHTTDLGSKYEKVKHRFVYKWVFRGCDDVIFVSSLQRQHWLNRTGFDPHRTYCIRNGIDVGHYSDSYSSEEKVHLRKALGFAENDYVVGICAGLRREKGHSDLMDAAVRIRSEGVRMKLLMIGDGSLRATVEAGIRERKLGQDTVITGFKEDVRPYMAICDSMALASHAVETFSLAILEAMSMGKPVVVSDIGGAREQVVHGENGFLFSKGDIASLARYLLILANEPVRSTMGKTAREYVAKHFTLDSMVSAYTRIFLPL
jgi:glycosyltransferase involved in cell wall biosynthesis